MKFKYIVIGFLITFSSCNQEKKEQKTETKCIDEKNIELSTVSLQNVTETIHLTGSIEENPETSIHYASLIDGIISKTYFTLGDKVTKNQVLAEVESSELLALQAELNGLKSQIEIAKDNLDAKLQLAKDGISSNKELTEAKNELRILETQKTKVLNNLKLFNAHSSKNVFLIKAPASGIITEKNINSGSVITNNGQNLFSISNLDNVWAMANIYATEIGQIEKGMDIELKTISYPNEIFKGKINEISQVLDKDAKVLKARIVLSNKDFKLKPGMIADIVAIKQLNQQALAIPTSAIVFFNNKNYVLAYKDSCNIEAREISILSKKDATTYITSGLNENEKIITKNQLLIFESLQK